MTKEDEATVPVTVTAALGDEVSISAGIIAGDRVVVDGADKLTDGARATEVNQ